MEVRPAGTPRRADLGDHLPLFDLLPLLDHVARIVGVGGVVIVWMSDNDQLAIAREPPLEGDSARSGGLDRRTPLGPDIDTVVAPTAADAVK